MDVVSQPGAVRHLDLVALEAATQDLAHTVWQLERLSVHPEAGALRDDLARLHTDTRAALVRHRHVLAGVPQD